MNTKVFITVIVIIIAPFSDAGKSSRRKFQHLLASQSQINCMCTNQVITIGVSIAITITQLIVYA